MNYRTILSSVAVVVLLLTTGFVSAQEPPEEFQELYEEYVSLSQELQTTHQLAMQDPEVVQGSEEFSEYIDKELKDISPEVAEMVEERNDIVDDIEAASEAEDQEAMEDLQPRYQQISQTLQPHINEVLQKPEVQERQMELEMLLMDKMIEIDPDTEDKLERLEYLSEELQRMMEE